MTQPLDDAQRACLERGRPLAVVAGAGSGKTRVLVERYLALLADYAPAEIVAITFTRKAAAEIKGRVRAELLARIAAGSGPEVDRLRLALDRLSGARIGTIDGFFAELLREAPLDCGLDPGFQVASEPRQAWLIEEAMAGELRELAAAPPGHPGRAALVEALDAAGSRTKVEAKLRVLLRDRRLLARLRGQGADGLLAAWEATRRQDLATLGARLAADPEVADHLARGSSLAGGADPGDPLAGLWRELGAAAAGLPGPEAAAALAARLLDEKGHARKFGRTGVKKGWGGGGLDEAREAAGGLAGRLARSRDLAVAPAPAPAEAAAAALAAALGELAGRVDERYRRLLREQGLVDFQELDLATSRLLDSPGAGRILARLAARFRVFLLDEMQDTNRTQWAILGKLALGTGAGAEPFLVGDPKQAIYGFRRADVRAFFGACQDLSGDRGGPLVLARNYRSAPAVLAFVNGLFAGLMGEEDGGFEVPFAPLEAAVTRSGGGVEVLLVPPGDAPVGEDAEEGGAGGGEAEAELVARRIAWLVRGPEAAAAGSIAILLRRREPLPAIEAALRRLGLPHRVHGGIGFYQRQEVRDMVSLARVLADPGDELALAAVLRGPLFALPDEALFGLARDEARSWGEALGAAGEARLARAARLLAAWRARVGREPPAAVLRRAMDEGGLWVALRGDPEAERALANLEKLLDVVRELPGDLAEVAAYLRRQVDDEEGEGEAGTSAASDDAISIMTVHAAKGLEFGTVFVPDLGRRFQNRADQGIALDPDGLLGVSTPEWCADAEGEVPRTWAYQRALRRRSAQDRAEEKRLFYVACTRARDRLVLVGRAEDPAAPDPAKARSWLDWLRVHAGPAELPTTGEAEEFEAHGIRIMARVGPAAIPEAERTVEVEPPRLVDRLDPELPPGEPAMGPAFESGAARLRTVPATALLDARCPRRFALRQLVGLDPVGLAALVAPPRDPARAGPGGGREAGIAFHAAVEARLGRVGAAAAAGAGAGPGVPEADAQLGAMLDALERDRVWGRIRNSSSRLVEEGFLLPVGGTELAGAIDLAFEEPDGSWTVLDWKTNRPPGDGQDAWAARLAKEYEPQLLAYALALEARGLRVGRIALWLARAGRLEERALAPGEANAARARMAAFFASLEAGKLGRADADPADPVTPGTCRACPVRGFCPEALEPPEQV